MYTTMNKISYKIMRQKGSFWNRYKMKSFKLLPKLVLSGCMPMSWGFFQMMTLGWPWPFLWQGQICFLTFLYGWQLIKHRVLMYFHVCSNSAYPQHSGEIYRTNGPLRIRIVYWWNAETTITHLWLRKYFSSLQIKHKLSPKIHSQESKSAH